MKPIKGVSFMFLNIYGIFKMTDTDIYGIDYYYTYTPHPLCDDISFIEPDEELYDLLIKANKLIGTLDGLLMSGNVRDVYIDLILADEAYYSCLIDGYNLTFLDFIRKNRQKDKYLYNYTNTLNNCPAKQVAKKQMCEMHHQLFGDKDSFLVGNYRDKIIYLTPLLIIKSERYNPTSPKDIEPAMKDLFSFINKKTVFDMLVKSALIHYQFEAIHPFEAENGIIGRILTLLSIMYDDYLIKPAINLSKYLHLYKVEYFDRLEAVHT